MGLKEGVRCNGGWQMRCLVMRKRGGGKGVKIAIEIVIESESESESESDGYTSIDGV